MVEQYLLREGGVCPNEKCGSRDINNGFVEYAQKRLIQPVTCVACGATWKEVYVLADIIEFKEAVES